MISYENQELAHRQALDAHIDALMQQMRRETLEIKARIKTLQNPFSDYGLPFHLLLPPPPVEEDK